MVSLIRQVDERSINQTIPVVERKNTVEGVFDNVDLSEPYTFVASAVMQDLVTPLGRTVRGTVHTTTFNKISLPINAPKEKTSTGKFYKASS